MSRQRRQRLHLACANLDRRRNSRHPKKSVPPVTWRLSRSYLRNTRAATPPRSADDHEREEPQRKLDALLSAARFMKGIAYGNGGADEPASHRLRSTRRPRAL